MEDFVQYLINNNIAYRQLGNNRIRVRAIDSINGRRLPFVVNLSTGIVDDDPFGPEGQKSWTLEKDTNGDYYLKGVNEAYRDQRLFDEKEEPLLYEVIEKITVSKPTRPAKPAVSTKPSVTKSTGTRSNTTKKYKRTIYDSEGNVVSLEDYYPTKEELDTLLQRLGQKTPVSLQKGDKIEEGIYDGGNPLGEDMQVMVTRKRPVEMPSYELTENDTEYKNRQARELAESAKFNTELIKRTNRAGKPFQAAFLAGVSIPTLAAAAPYIWSVASNPLTRSLIKKGLTFVGKQFSPKLTGMFTKEVPVTVGNVVKGLGLGAYNGSWILPTATTLLKDPLNPYNIGYAATTAAMGKGFGLIGKGFGKSYTAAKKLISKIK